MALMSSIKKRAQLGLPTSWLVLAAALAVIFSVASAWLPITGAIEEFSIVGVLLLLELLRSRSSFSRVAKKKMMLASVDDAQNDHRGMDSCSSSCEGNEAGNHYVGELQAAVKSGNLAAAEAIMNRMEQDGIKPSVVCYGTLISVCAKIGDVAGAEHWLEALIACGIGMPNAICVNITISACAKSGNVAKAEEWFARMQELGVQADVMSFNAVIDACARVSDYDRAEMWLNKMSKAGIPPNVVSYSSVLHACAKVGAADRAERWLKRMSAEGVEPNVICYNSIVHACSKAGESERASQWINHMLALGIAPTVNSYSTIIDRLAKSGDIEAAEMWLARMTASGVQAGFVVRKQNTEKNNKS